MDEQAPFRGRGLAEDPPPPEPGTRPIEGLSFEEAMGELEALVQQLERGQLDLDRAIGAFERGTALRRHCEAKLKEARLRVEKLAFDPDGEPRPEPFAEE